MNPFTNNAEQLNRNDLGKENEQKKEVDETGQPPSFDQLGARGKGLLAKANDKTAELKNRVDNADSIARALRKNSAEDEAKTAQIKGSTAMRNDTKDLLPGGFMVPDEKPDFSRMQQNLAKDKKQKEIESPDKSEKKFA